MNLSRRQSFRLFAGAAITPSVDLFDWNHANPEMSEKGDAQ